MKNNFLVFSLLIFLTFSFKVFSDEFEINSSKIQYDNNGKVTILEKNVSVKDVKGNKLFSEYAKYNKIEEIIQTKGETQIVTSGGYKVYGSNVVFNKKNNKIFSNDAAKIIDKDGNTILVDMFDYSTLNNIFFSKGNIKINDINKNKYNFSEVYIDENKKKIIGSDIKAFLDQPKISINPENNPRFFANTMSSSKKKNIFNKGVFTYCKNREGEKCPPWSLQSEKIEHDLATKTIYYDNVVLKVYDFPIFYSPKFSHPDPTVKRRSGLLAPSLTNSTTLGSGFATPYFWNISNDKDLTITPKFYLKENPLVLAEFRQDFKNSFLFVDTGYTPGYKKKDAKKSGGSRSHFFSNLNISLLDKEDEISNIEIKTEQVTNDTYFKIYDVETSLVKEDKTVLENKIDLNYRNKDFYLSLAPSIFEDTNKEGNSRHEYLLPLAIEKNIMSSQKYGFLDLGTNLRVRNYETNKQTNFLVNKFNWKSNKWLNSLGMENYFGGLIKNVNYESENSNEFKNDQKNAELNSALGYFTKLPLYKEDLANKNFHSLIPKFLLRYAPGHMRNANSGRLNYGNLFNLNKVDELDIVEPGLSTSIGVEYKKNKLNASNSIGDQELSFSVGQVISEGENNDIPSSTSLDQRFSDIVGEAQYNVSNKTNLKYNFSIDQNYKDFNYNEFGADFEVDKAKFNVSYLQEKNHIGNQEFIQTGFDFMPNNSTQVSFNTKRNLLTSSAEFYNLSYNYINDCLKAGIAYRREFYTDRDIEPTNSLMFTISIIPFAQINSPSLSR